MNSQLKQIPKSHVNLKKGRENIWVEFCYFNCYLNEIKLGKLNDINFILINKLVYNQNFSQKSYNLFVWLRGPSI